ncbi:MAG: MFS transporter [Hyphomicrobiales bacterium]|nr:MAG: MFS transporter [Hyphomicrobiales bacterium]
MTSPRAEAETAAPFAWSIVGVAFVLAAFAWGIGFYGPSILLQALHKARGWPIATISSAISLHFLLSAGMVVYLPEAHRRLGLTNVTLAGVGLAALGAVAWANAQATWQLFLAVPLSSAGWAATSGAAINAIVSPWFDKNRAKALSLAFNGASVGGVIFPPAWAALASAFGIANAAAILAAVMVAILCPLVFRFVRARPLRPETIREGDRAPSRNQLARRDLLRDRRFVSLSGAFALGLFAQVGLFAHLVARLGPVFGDAGAALALSATAASAVVGRTLLAWTLGDRIRRHAASANFVPQAAGVLLLVLASQPVPVGLGCILFGLGVGNLISLPPLIAQQEFEPQDVPTVVALVTAINQAVFACAPAIFGLLRDAAGDYTIAFALAACAQVAAALVIRASRAPR